MNGKTAPNTLATATPYCSRAAGRNFTLIERTPSKGRDYLYVESTYPANYPIRAGSLTSALPGRPGQEAR